LARSPIGLRDRFAAELCEYFLRTEGYEVCLASSAADAERSFIERRPSLAVVEVAMTGGLELCRQLAQDETPVLAVSPLAVHDDALAAGATAFSNNRANSCSSSRPSETSWVRAL
jgi:DNA-binding response OmpR family regulator